MEEREYQGREARLSDEEKAKLLIAAAEKYQSHYIARGYTPIGFWLLGLGWLITSESARNFLSQQLLVIISGIVFIWLNLILFIYFSFQVLNISEQLMSRLDNWPYVEGAYEHFRISKSTVISHCAFIAFIAILLTVLLVTIYDNPVY